MLLHGYEAGSLVVRKYYANESQNLNNVGAFSYMYVLLSTAYAIVELWVNT